MRKGLPITAALAAAAAAGLELVQRYGIRTAMGQTRDDTYPGHSMIDGFVLCLMLSSASRMALFVAVAATLLVATLALN